MSDRRSYDRLIGILTTVTGGLLLYVAHHWVKQLVVQYKKEKKENKPNTPDDLHELRYNKKSLVIHNGSCHCERVRFRIKAPKVLNAVDIPSKIRFPRVTIPCEHFEPLTTSDDNIMSLYAVKAEADVNSGVGVYTFCSFCGVHVLFSPSTDPVEVFINVDCIDQRTVEKINMSYIGIPETIPHSVAYEPARPFNKKGLGSTLSPSLYPTTYAPSYISQLDMVVSNNMNNNQQVPIDTSITSDEYLKNKSVFYYDNYKYNNIIESPTKDDYYYNHAAGNSDSKRNESNMIDTSVLASWANISSSPNTYTNASSNAEYNTPAKIVNKKNTLDHFAINTPVHRQLSHHLKHYLHAATEEIDM